MSDALRLLPNLGAEEGSGWGRMLRVPRVASAARLWQELFPSSARMLDGYLDSPDAPAARPTTTRVAAFEWLTKADGCVPWLANAAAREIADAAGLRLVGPPASVVEQVNDKAFALESAEAEGFVPRPLRGTSVALEPALLADPDRTVARMNEAMDQWPAWARRAFTLKPRRGTSSRGRIDGRGTPDLGALRAGLKALAHAGGAIFEPWLERAYDLSAQLRIDDEGSITLLGTLEQRTSPRGAVLGHRGEIDSRGRIFSGLPEDEDLREAAAAIVAAAGRRGYQGPCGVDAFVFSWHDEAGTLRQTLRPVVELNARFTLGIVALGLVRRRIALVRDRLGLRPGDRRAFELRLDAPAGGWAAACARAGDAAFVVPLHEDAETVRPAILFARSRTNVEAALEDITRPAGNTLSEPTR